MGNGFNGQDREDLQPGRLVRLSARVQRLVAPNASLMTGPGTNSYVLGSPAVAVLDPGPDDPQHLAMLRAATPGLRFVFVTHTHRDHSCGARALADAAGAELIGLPPPSDGLQEMSCVPDIEARHDRVFEINGRTGLTGHATVTPRAIQSPDTTRLRAIHTPGHASNHVCFLLEEEGLLFSGDHVLDGVTPVILPPDGDMAAYLHSLELLKGCQPRAIAPGHGGVLTDPIRVIDGIVAHRARREAKVVGVLAAAGRGDTDELLPKVYDDVRPELLPIARYSLEAHLIKLEREGRALREQGVWSLRDEAPGGARSAAVPSAAVPSAAVPSAAMPSAAMPSAAVPSAAVPSAAVPSAAVPSAAMPSADATAGASGAVAHGQRPSAAGLSDRDTQAGGE